MRERSHLRILKMRLNHLLKLGASARTVARCVQSEDETLERTSTDRRWRNATNRLCLALSGRWGQTKCIFAYEWSFSSASAETRLVELEDTRELREFAHYSHPRVVSARAVMNPEGQGPLVFQAIDLIVISAQRSLTLSVQTLCNRHLDHLADIGKRIVVFATPLAWFSNNSITAMPSIHQIQVSCEFLLNHLVCTSLKTDEEYSSQSSSIIISFLVALKSCDRKS